MSEKDFMEKDSLRADSEKNAAGLSGTADNNENDILPFKASEAYKLLRTNLLFCMPDSDTCHIVGVSSAIGGEGKSTTAKNLALSLVKAGKKVLLTEFDLRLPTIAKLLPVKAAPGISNLIAGLASVDEVVQHHESLENFDIITSGDIPPNPSELLNSENTQKLLNELSGNYNFIIVDLPPINLVSDTLIVARLLEGIILVVRQNYNHRKELNEALRQLKMVDAKILGFVLNDSATENAKYRSKYRYKSEYIYKQSLDRKDKKSKSNK